jgi:hypothetical protein
MTTRWRTHRVITAALALLVACGSPRDNTAVSAQAGQYPTGTLDQMLAPIALYPDQLLAQMLMSAADPAKVAELDTWMKSNAQLKGTPLQDAAVKAGFEASFVALTLFPQVVAKMAEQIEPRCLRAFKNSGSRRATWERSKVARSSRLKRRRHHPASK